MKVKVTKLEEKGYYYVSLTALGTTIEGKFERSELRHLIGEIDNKI